MEQYDKIKKEFLAVDKNAKQLYSQKELLDKLQIVAKQISKDYKNKNLICLCVLNGGIVTLGQLLPLITCPTLVDSIHLTRYNGKTTASKNIQWKSKPSINLNALDVLLVDDILDEGITLFELTQYCKAQKANSVKSMVLVNKTHNRKFKNIKADYVACNVPDEYVYGFGMDFKEFGRNKSEIVFTQK